MARAAFYFLALAVFPVLGLVIAIGSSSSAWFPLLLGVPALLTFVAGVILARSSVERGIVALVAAGMGIVTWIGWIAYAIVVEDARPFD